MTHDPSEGTPTEVRDAVFPIVAVGGSAGSLVAFQELIHNLHSDASMALVVVSHQDPTRPSLLPEILSKSTQMPVTQLSGDECVEPGHIYIAPSGHYLSIEEGGAFHIEKGTERGHPPLPIDFFMRSLAAGRGSRAVGVVLSGTGSDGTLGLAAIRNQSGLTLVQQPDTAEFSGMPSSAIAAGVVDLVLGPAEIAQRLVAHAKHLSVPAERVVEGPRASDDIERILELVTAHTRRDFSSYKRGTIERRLERRLQLHGKRNLTEYLALIRDHPEECEALSRDWLIGVSEFFRDGEAFEALGSAVVDMLRERPDGSSLRVWVPGCAMGQEAYSVAIVILEAAEKLGKRIEPQIFATDLDESAIDTGRSGSFPVGVAAEMSPERLRRFFDVEDQHFVVKKDVRERIVFAVQNLLEDPPFTRVDLISCRNVLIYFDNEAQKRILPLFHFSLNPGGLLFLGSSESVMGLEELFSAVDRESKVFRRVETSRIMYAPSDFSSERARNLPLPPATRSTANTPALDLGDVLRRQLAARYAPPGVIVDQEGNVEQIHGRTGEYLEPAPGQPNMNVLDMARNGLRAPLASALREVVRSGQANAERDARVKTNGHDLRVRLHIAQISEARLLEPLYLILFEPLEEQPSAVASISEQGASDVPPARAQQIEEELRLAREDHQTTVEELQATNEELASANEEVQSVNEELQSTIEELQTTREETQSLNEELQTLNAELLAKVSSLEQANDDLRNLMDSTEIAIIFVDDRLCVKRFTPSTRSLVPLIASDVGRPLADIAMTIEYPDLLEEAEAVLRTLAMSEREVCTQSGQWYSVQIRPYRTSRNTIEGISIVFIDITPTKHAELTAQFARDFEEDIVQALREPFLVLESDLKVVRANASFHRTFQTRPEDVEQRNIFELGDGQWDVPQLRDLLERMLPENATFDDVEVECAFPTIGRRVMLLNARRVERAGAEPDLILLAIEDITGQEASNPGDQAGSGS